MENVNIRYFIGSPLAGTFLFTRKIGEVIVPSRKELVLYEGDEYIIRNVCHCIEGDDYGIEVYMDAYNFELEDR